MPSYHTYHFLRLFGDCRLRSPCIITDLGKMDLKLIFLLLCLFLYIEAQQKKAVNKDGASTQLVNLLKDLRAAKKAPAPAAWNKFANVFCKNFPKHPSCRDGKKPKFEDKNKMLRASQKRVVTQRQKASIKKQMQRKKIKRIPKLQKKDPLANAPTDLANKLDDNAKKFGRFKSENKAKVKKACARVNCKSFKEHRAKRDKLKKQMKKFRQTVKKTTVDNAADDDELELELQRTRQLKKALLEKADLAADVDPADDGVYDGDLLLTTEQSEFLLNELDKGGVEEEEPLPPGFEPTTIAPQDDPDYDSNLAEADDYDVKEDDSDDDAENGNTQPPEPVMSRRARAALFFEEQYVRKWDINSPIYYTFHDSLEETDKNDVRRALSTISANVPCIKFQYVSQPITNGYFLYYMKTDMPGFCGLSRIGKVQGGNEIYLSFQCNGNVGVAIHETMHSLGVDHQQIRMDRDQWITVDWSNVNPQMYDSLAVSDSRTFTTYGVPYDYASIMHYNAYTAAIDYSKPTLNPKYNAAQNIRVMGQRDAMTQRDVEILRKMYCKASNCIDTNVYCGAWALSNLCNSVNNGGWMQQNCRKSCNLC